MYQWLNDSAPARQTSINVHPGHPPAPLTHRGHVTGPTRSPICDAIDCNNRTDADDAAHIHDAPKMIDCVVFYVPSNTV